MPSAPPNSLPVSSTADAAPARAGSIAPMAISVTSVITATDAGAEHAGADQQQHQG